MKPLRGFSPLSVATLVVAAVWLPIVLFPYGGAILMNIVFVYGLREYRASKGEDIFRIFTWITAFTCTLFLLIALVVPFEPAYRLLREAALIGWVLREDLPSGQALTVLQWVVVGALLCANPLFVRLFSQTAEFFDQPIAPQQRSDLQYYWDRLSALPVVYVLLIGLQIAYLSGFMDKISSSDGDRIGRWGIRVSDEAAVLLLNFAALGPMTCHSVIRAILRDRSRKRR